MTRRHIPTPHALSYSQSHRVVKSALRPGTTPGRVSFGPWVKKGSVRDKAFEFSERSLGDCGASTASGRYAWRLPRSSEARPASTDRVAETPNTTTRPLWNGPASRLGKNWRPVSAAWLAAGSFASTPVGSSRCWIGLTPRTEANSDDTGGRAAMLWATPDGTPTLVRPPLSDVGSLLDRPAISSVKTMPMETAVPEFWNVARIPEAAPRSLAGTLPMIEEELGEANMPLPMPFTAISAANIQ